MLLPCVAIIFFITYWAEKWELLKLSRVPNPSAGDLAALTGRPALCSASHLLAMPVQAALVLLSSTHVQHRLHAYDYVHVCMCVCVSMSMSVVGFEPPAWPNRKLLRLHQFHNNLAAWLSSHHALVVLSVHNFMCLWPCQRLFQFHLHSSTYSIYLRCVSPTWLIRMKLSSC